MRVPVIAVWLLGSQLFSSTVLAAPADEIMADLEKAKAAFKTGTDESRANLLAAFDEAEKAIAQTGDLDGVKANRAERAAYAEKGTLPTSPRMRAAAVGSGPVAESANELKQALTGTRWDWGDGILTFNADGLVGHPAWEGRGHVTRWEAIDRRTVVLSVSGPDGNKTGVLQFADDLRSVSSFDFMYSEKRMMTKKRVEP